MYSKSLDVIYHKGKILKASVHGRGDFSTYLLLKPNIGLKVFAFRRTTRAALLSTKGLLKVKKEFNIQRKAWRAYPALVPKPLRLIYIQDAEKSWRVAIEMEHIEGKSLAEFKSAINRNTVFWNNGRISFLLGENLEGAIDKMFKKVNIAHRDLHSGNILITKDKKVKVIDFGIAKDFF